VSRSLRATASSMVDRSPRVSCLRNRKFLTMTGRLVVDARHYRVVRQGIERRSCPAGLSNESSSSHTFCLRNQQYRTGARIYPARSDTFPCQARWHWPQETVGIGANINLPPSSVQRLGRVHRSRASSLCTTPTTDPGSRGWNDGWIWAWTVDADCIPLDDRKYQLDAS